MFNIWFDSNLILGIAKCFRKCIQEHQFFKKILFYLMEKLGCPVQFRKKPKTEKLKKNV